MTVVAPGSRVTRNEDEPLLRGTARYVADLALGQLYAAFVRAPVASGRIRSIDTTAAARAPGVVGVATAGDLGLGRLCAHLSGMISPDFDRPPLATDVVRFVGECVAIVVATSRAAAFDAADLVEVDYEVFRALVDPEEALGPDARVLFPGHGSNAAHSVVVSDEDALADAEVVVRARVVNQRVAPAPMEPEGALAVPGEPSGGLTIYASTQRVHHLRDEVARLLDLPPDLVRIVTPQVGGGFGGKYDTPAECVVTAAMAVRLGRPVLWYDTRSEAMLAMTHGRGQIQYGELGLRRDGTVTGLRVRIVGDAGGYPMIGALVPGATVRMLPGLYGVPRVDAEITSAATNTTPVGAYRGAGRPEAAALLERLMDLAALELGVDAVELRRKNLLSPEQFPFSSVTGMLYDVGEYAKTLDAALDHVGYAALRAEQAERRRRGDRRQLGIGVAMWLDATPLNRPGEYAGVDIRLDPGRGLDVAVRAGTCDHGQGHGTSWGIILSGVLGVPLEAVRLVPADTANVPHGEGTGSARSLQVTGNSVLAAGRTVLEQARAIAAHVLEAAPEDIVVAPGAGLAVAGSPGRGVSWEDLAVAAGSPDLPGEIRSMLATGGLGAEADVFQSGPTFPSGTHIAVVEVDVETGGVDLIRFVAVDDCGRVVNPTTFEGQQHGGIVQGVAEALFEQVTYDADGNPQNGTFLTYLVPTAADLPTLEVSTIETPTPVNTLGAKGIGQGGAVGATPAAQSAVIDALSHLGVRHLDIPITPEAVWRAVAAGGPTP